MRLKSIKLAGFKSFVDPTTVHFPSNLSAVVGPNGCGKSNVIDAVRWVMGESSAKYLRGESMTDVIFNGSSSRKPVGQAVIELLFDNSDGALGGEYASYAEISIRRKVTRDGQSNYSLNGKRCRRRDITDIFLGTGLGPRSYAIIEQGMISRLIEAKPEELRVYIEEAAGISKYKERRRDTESRMRRTRENLERLTDIRDELGRQLQRLERQAQAAEKYADFKKEERLLKAQLQALRWRALDGQLQSKASLISRQELDVEALVTERSACDTALEKQRSQYSDNSAAFNEIQGTFYGIGAEVARLEQAIEHSRQRIKELQEDIHQTETNYSEAERHLREDQQRCQSWRLELESIRPQLAELEGLEDSLGSSLDDAEQIMALWQSRWDDFNQKAASPRQQAEVQQSRIQHIEQVLRRLTDRYQRLDDECQTLDLSLTEEKVALLEEQLAEAELLNEEKQQRVEDRSHAIDQSRATRHGASQELGHIREKIQAATGRKASLDALQQAALDEGDDSRAWLAAQSLQDQPRLAENLKVTEGWEAAVETVLATDLQGVCVEDIGAFANSLATLNQGELLLVDGSQALALVEQPNLTPLSSVVSGALIDRLHGVFAVETLAQALTLRGQLQGGQSLISRDGLWVGANWMRVARGNKASGGVIKRQQELTVLKAELQQLMANLANKEAAQHDAEETLKVLENDRQRLSRDLADQQRSYAELRSRLSAGKMEVEQIASRRNRAHLDLDDIRQQQQLEQENLAEARQLLEAALDIMENHSQQRELLVAEKDQLRQRLDDARQVARQGRDQRHQLSMRERSLSTQLQSADESIGRLDVQVARLNERREQLREALNQQDDPREALRLQLEERLEKRLSIEEKMAEARRKLEAVEAASRETEGKRSQLEHQLLNKRADLEKMRLGAQELSTLSKTIVAQINQHHYSLETLLDELDDGANPRQWEEALEQLGNRIQRLGAINLAAIDEFKIEAERKTYLDTQHDELIEALDTLENAMRKIDRETRTRFKETFDVVNTSLQSLFPKVFGGGHAYLDLTGDDLLNTGVTIMARPPGKKNTTIHLLSGGEKALTAIALVFSIFSLNPAPFCMLDEVDAPLDDANVGRYARLVEEMSAQVQFIYITHNKIAMEMAQQLMGVTMYEPGVSRLVTVDVDKAVELAEA